MKKLTLYALGAAALTFAATGCEDDNGPGNSDMVKEWTIQLSGDQEVPSTNRTETGTAHLVLYSNNELEYEITVDGLASGDELTMAHVHPGGPVSNGPAEITVVDGDTRTFTGNTAMGSIALTQENVDLLMGDSIYFNVHSVQAPKGLIRGQMDQEIVFADDIRLESDNITGGSSAIGEASGTVYLRRSSDGVLFYKVVNVEIDNLTDQITEGSIYKGPAGADGEFLQDLSFEQEDINTTKKVTLNASTIQTLEEEDTYIQLNSQFAPDGLMRGQIER